MLPASATPTLQCHLGAGTPSWLCDCIQLCVWLWVSWVFYPASCKFCSSASSRNKTHKQDKVQTVYIRLVIPLGGKCRTMSRLLLPVYTPLPTRPWVSVIPPPCGQVFVLSLWIVMDAKQANRIRAPNLCSSEYPIKTTIKLTFKFLPTKGSAAKDHTCVAASRLKNEGQFYSLLCSVRSGRRVYFASLRNIIPSTSEGRREPCLKESKWPISVFLFGFYTYLKHYVDILYKLWKYSIVLWNYNFQTWLRGTLKVICWQYSIFFTFKNCSG